MGEVHRARHLKLGRDVAIKVLPTALARDPTLLARFEREARSASALSHPNIVIIYDIAEYDGTTYIAMELVEGRTLRRLIADGPLPVDQALGYAQQMAEGLAKAHAVGIVHRDLKPDNLMVTTEGVVKILDFGLAKPLVGSAAREAERLTLTSDTQEGIVVGTPHYMSPEQFSGGPVDHCSDQFAFGVVLYEVLSGRPPFDGPSVAAIMSAVVLNQPPPLRQLRPEVPAALDRIISRCLAKDPAGRFSSTSQLASELDRCRRQRAGTARRVAAFLKRPAGAATLAAAACILVAGGWLWSGEANRRWARGDALAEITRLTELGDLYQAYRTALRAERYQPDNAELKRMLNRITLPLPVNTQPPGAEVWVKGYTTPDAAWERLGVTPLTKRIPYAMMRWRINREGYEPFEGAPLSSSALAALAQGIQLDRAGSRPPGTVRIPGGTFATLPGTSPPDELPAVQLGSFFLDRYEVTNRQYREFVDAGGYRRQDWWPRPIQRGKTDISWRDAMAHFVDASGRPGPSTWEVGSYAAGTDDYPVGGISWYEAAGYCAFAGKSLPTVYHWSHALGQDQLSDILLHSNIDGEAKAPAGKFQGLSAYGTYDMAGNVKEWVWNASAEGRYILGGAWNEPGYLFKHLVAEDPLSREPTNGVRCASYPEPTAASLLAPITVTHEYQRPPPLTKEAFTLLKGLYAYDKTPLDARVERVNDSLPNYRWETVSYRTAYGNDRMETHLLMPRDGSPPYQVVVWFPGSDAFLLPSSESFASTYLFDFIPRTGRVLVYPVYKAMYERAEPLETTPSAERDMVVRWTQDISRTLDYLETRSDLAQGKYAFYGFSLGAVKGPVFTAVEPRFAASILLGGGLTPDDLRPEVDPARFAPWVRTPTLMINGRDDFLMPYELSAKPLLELLGTPAQQKRHARLEGGHIPTNRLDIVREVLAWLDRHLGPVNRSDS
jgi:formylglycine-generating enzyme required for sulfatase activity/predicted esterase